MCTSAATAFCPVHALFDLPHELKELVLKGSLRTIRKVDKEGYQLSAKLCKRLVLNPEDGSDEHPLKLPGGNLDGLNEIVADVQRINDVFPVYDFNWLAAVRLPSLTSLCLTGYWSYVTDIEALGLLSKLQTLELGQMEELDVLTPLGALTDLRRLVIYPSARLLNSDAPFLFLQHLTRLTQLYVMNCRVSSNAPGVLHDLCSLQALWIMNAGITSLSSLQLRCESSLQHMSVSGPEIRDISAITALTSLQSLCLHVINEPVPPLSSLQHLEKLELHGVVTDIIQISSLTNLIHLNLDDTLVLDVSPVSPLTQLRTLFLCHTLITDISPLSTIRHLHTLDLSHTHVSNIQPLLCCTDLYCLDLQRTQCTQADVDQLWEALPKLSVIKM